MNSDDLKLFALFYIKEQEDLSDKDKIDLMNFIENANDEEVTFLLATGYKPGETVHKIKEIDGQAYRLESGAAVVVGTASEVLPAAVRAARTARIAFQAGKAGYMARKIYKTAKEDVPKEEGLFGDTTINLAASAVSALAHSLAYKINRKKMAQLSKKCEKEKGMAKKVCFNKVRRDAIRSEILALSSMKIKCRKTKNSELCVQNIDKKIKSLQQKMDAIKVF